MKRNVMMRSRMVAILLLVCIGTLYSAKTNAATITSINSGSWEVGTVWDSGTPPSATDDVIIATNNYVSIFSNISVASLTIESEDLTVFTINSGYTLTVTGNVYINAIEGAISSQIACNGNLIIEGDLIFNGEEAISQAQISMGDGSSFTLNGAINYLGFGRFWASSTGNNYTSTFNTAGNLDIRFTSNRFRNLVFNASGTVNMLTNMTATTVYGNVEIAGGALSNNGFTITGVASRTLTIQPGAELRLTSTTGLPAGFDMVVAPGGTIHYAGGNQTVGTLNNSQEYGNLQISGTGTKTLGGNTVVRNNLTISSSTLDVDNTNNYSIQVGGNFNNSGTFMPRTGSVTFNGSNPQSITSGGSSFYNVTYNNTHGSGITLNDDMTVTNIVTFTNGVVSTGVNRLVIDNTAASAITGHSSASFVNGRLRRYIATNTSTYAFPVGNSTATNGYKLAELVNNNLDGTSYIDARFGALTNHNDADLSTSDSYMTYLSVAPAGVWHITPNVQPSSGSYDIYLSIVNMGVLSDNEFGILKRNDGSTSAGDWSAPGTMNADDGAGRLVADGYAVRMGLGSFSEFGIGRASTSGNPLPIELVSFSAKATANKQVVLDWMTAIEINNEYFTIERSTDGTNFEEIAQIEGAGNSVQVKTYSAIDADPAKGINYYRLKQTDYDGAHEYSNMVTVNIGQATQPTAEVTVYPNPANTGQQIQISITNTDTDTDFEVEVYEIGSGRLIHNTFATGQNSMVNMPQGLAAGIYLVRVSNGAEVQNHKLFVK